MTDPVTNMDVEDVLSSIRRLVSDTPRDGASRSDAAAAERKPMKRLVLTPAQRVAPLPEEMADSSDLVSVDPDDAQEDAPLAFRDGLRHKPQRPLEQPSSEPASLTEVEGLARKLLGPKDTGVQEMIIAEIRAALSRGTDLPAAPLTEGGQGDARAEASPHVPPEDAAPGGDQALALDDMPETVAAEAGQEDEILWLSGSETRAEPTLFDNDTPALASSTADDREEPENTVAFRSARGKEPLRLVEPVVLADDADQETGTFHLQADAESLVAAPAPVNPSQVAKSLEDKIAELEALIGRQSDWDPEPQDSGGNAASDIGAVDDMPWQDADTASEAEAEAEGTSDPEFDEQSATTVSEDEVTGEDLVSHHEPPTTIASPVAAAALPEPRRPDLTLVPTPVEEVAMDEDQLRALISRMVREELQGVLGERITRNVRKLVRREVQRALMNRDLD